MKLKKPTYIVLGATGGLGRAVVAELQNHNCKVIAVGRSIDKLHKFFDNVDVELIQADPMLQAELIDATTNAEMVFNCINAPYNKWDVYWPILTENILVAMAENKFKHVFADNVYAFGPIVSDKLRVTQPMNPVGQKGNVRKNILLDYKKDPIIWKNTVVAHFPDFFGPTMNNGYQENQFLDPLKNSGSFWTFNDTQPHSLIFTVDAARALVKLGLDPSSYGKQWIVASEEAPTGKEFYTILFGHLNKPPKYRVFKKWMIRFAGFVSPIIKELLENEYQWNEPFILDGSEFQKKYSDFQFTPLSEAIAITLEEFAKSLKVSS